MSTDETKKEDDRPFLFPGSTPVVFKKRQLGQKRPFICAPGELPKVGERFEIDVTGNDRWFRMFGLVTRAFKNDLAAMNGCLLYTSPSPRDQRGSRMPSSA